MTNFKATTEGVCKYLERLSDQKFRDGSNDASVMLTMAAHMIRKHERIKLLKVQLGIAIGMLEIQPSGVLSMKKRAKKQWNGGVIPERSAIDDAWVAHMEACNICQFNPLDPCPEGGKLARALYEQYEGGQTEDGDWKSRPDGGPK